MGPSTWRRRLSFYYSIFSFFFRIHYFFVDEFWKTELQQSQTETSACDQEQQNQETAALL